MPDCRKSHLIFQNFLESSPAGALFGDLPPYWAPLSKIPGSAPGESRMMIDSVVWAHQRDRHTHSHVATAIKIKGAPKINAQHQTDRNSAQLNSGHLQVHSLTNNKHISCIYVLLVLTILLTTKCTCARKCPQSIVQKCKPPNTAISVSKTKMQQDATSRN